jgi:hypothetical protein
MAKQIVVLGVSQSATSLSINAVFWFPITSGALPRTAGSAWVGASPAENAAIQAGTVLEEGYGDSFPVGTTTVAIKDILNKAWTQRQNALNGVGPNTYNGIFFDGATGWSA